MIAASQPSHPAAFLKKTADALILAMPKLTPKPPVTVLSSAEKIRLISYYHFIYPYLDLI